MLTVFQFYSKTTRLVVVRSTETLVNFRPRWRHVGVKGNSEGTPHIYSLNRSHGKAETSLFTCDPAADSQVSCGSRDYNLWMTDYLSLQPPADSQSVKHCIKFAERRPNHSVTYKTLENYSVSSVNLSSSTTRRRTQQNKHLYFTTQIRPLKETRTASGYSTASRWNTKSWNSSQHEAITLKSTFTGTPQLQTHQRQERCRSVSGCEGEETNMRFGWREEQNANEDTLTSTRYTPHLLKNVIY